MIKSDGNRSYKATSDAGYGEIRAVILKNRESYIKLVKGVLAERLLADLKAN